MTGNNQRIIPLDEGWDLEIKAKVCSKCSLHDCGAVEEEHAFRDSIASRTDSSDASLALYCISQAIVKLEDMLNNGLKAGRQTKMFGPKEYVEIYT
jgi:hypothetical protein